jgi:hypothetical protein
MPQAVQLGYWRIRLVTREGSNIHYDINSVPVEIPRVQVSGFRDTKHTMRTAEKLVEIRGGRGVDKTL